MESDPRFDDEYRRVLVHGEHPVPMDFHAFCRLEGRVGVERSNESARIPGYLFANGKGTRAELDDAKALGTRFVRFSETTLKGVELPAGSWRFKPVGEGSFELSARQQSGVRKAVRLREGAVLVLAEPRPIDITVVTRPPAFLTEIVAQQIDD
jgi:hypothetical protein